MQCKRLGITVFQPHLKVCTFVHTIMNMASKGMPHNALYHFHSPNTLNTMWLTN